MRVMSDDLERRRRFMRKYFPMLAILGCVTLPLVHSFRRPQPTLREDVTEFLWNFILTVTIYVPLLYWTLLRMWRTKAHKEREYEGW